MLLGCLPGRQPPSGGISTELGAWETIWGESFLVRINFGFQNFRKPISDS
jgi:hypothetical protein